MKPMSMFCVLDRSHHRTCDEPVVRSLRRLRNATLLAGASLVLAPFGAEAQKHAQPAIRSTFTTNQGRVAQFQRFNY